MSNTLKIITRQLMETDIHAFNRQVSNTLKALTTVSVGHGRSPLDRAIANKHVEMVVLDGEDAVTPIPMIADGPHYFLITEDAGKLSITQVNTGVRILR